MIEHGKISTRHKYLILTLLLGGFILALSGCSSDRGNRIVQTSINTEPGIFKIERMFSKDDLFCPNNTEEGGRLSKRQCYVPVPCHETGARLKNIVCDEARDVGDAENLPSDPYPHAP